MVEPIINKPKKERHKKEKKLKVECKIEPAKLKYFAEFKANIKGQRYNIGYIIETNNDKDILNIVTKRLFDEQQGVRTINCLLHRLAKEDDREYFTAIELPKSEEIVQSNNNENEDEQDKKYNFPFLIKEVFDGEDGVVLNGKSMYGFKAVITPGRKPRPKDFKNAILIFANNASDALNEFKRELDDNIDASYKNQWLKVLPVEKGTLHTLKGFIKFIKNSGLFSFGDIEKLSKEQLDKINSKCNLDIPNNIDSQQKIELDGRVMKAILHNELLIKLGGNIGD